MAKTEFKNKSIPGEPGTIVTEDHLNRLNNQVPTGEDLDGSGPLLYGTDKGAADAYVLPLSFGKQRASSTNDSTDLNKLKNSSADFNADGVEVGDTVLNLDDRTSARVTGVASTGTELTLDADIFTATGKNYAVGPGIFQAPVTLEDGIELSFKAVNDNTGPSTLDVNGLGSVSIKKPDGVSDLEAGDIKADQVVKVQYDGTNWQMRSALMMSAVVDKVTGLSRPQILNGSFELDTDGDGVPDNFAVTTYPGGSQSLDTTSPAHGAKCLKFTHPGGAGNGGGYATSDFIEATPLRKYVLKVTRWCEVAGMKVVVRVKYYDKDKTFISNNDLSTDTANPTSAKRFYYGFVPPATARYMKIELHGGVSDTDAAGSAYFDDLDLVSDIDKYYAPGSFVVAQSVSVASVYGTSWTKLKEILIDRPGILTVYFSMQVSGGTGHGQIYKNGAPAGTERTTSAQSTWPDWSEDVYVEPGDLVQFYARNNTGDKYTYVKDFKLMSATQTYVMTVNL